MSDLYITEPVTTGKVCLETTLGDVDIELWTKECPLACRNFIQLCMENYYNKCIFFVTKDFIIKTGDKTNTGEGGSSIYGQDFKVERHQRLRFNRRGLVAMAANEQGLNGSQFFITLDAIHDLHGKHTLFGKITGTTIFNILKLNEVETDADNKPVKTEYITGSRILSNPFDDIVPRRIIVEKKIKNKKERQLPAMINKNTGLLSFGDEMDEEEQLIQATSSKGKSAHDVLEDERLSKLLAVLPEEIGTYSTDAKKKDDNTNQLSKVQERLRKKTSKSIKHDNDRDKNSGDEEDYEGALDEQRDIEKQLEKDKLKEELRSIQKDYIKAVRGPKQKPNPNDPSNFSAGIKAYQDMKLKFKSKTTNVVKSRDPQRESQTLSLLSRFETRVKRAGVKGVLMNKTVDMSDQKSSEQLLEESAVPKKRKLPADMLIKEVKSIETDDADEEVYDSTTIKFDEEVEDEPGLDWMKNPLVAPKDISGVTKARDANLREQDEEWYSLVDPRNRINQRRRGEGEPSVS